MQESTDAQLTMVLRALLLEISGLLSNIRLKLQVVEKMLLWLEPWLKHLHAQLMETLNPTSNGAMTKLEERFQVGHSWKQGKVGASLVLEVTLLEHQSISHSALLFWPNKPKKMLEPLRRHPCKSEKHRRGTIKIISNNLNQSSLWSVVCVRFQSIWQRVLTVNNKTHIALIIGILK
ncbi:uncharacterized protein LOC141866048 isoform X2 [Acropora palmata]|uniref:uncharacterized protein LOC141866048 isoform X2 n=1 Tax=Acropora palmata TaxID=6131 RepID=UPI003DA1B55C